MIVQQVSAEHRAVARICDRVMARVQGEAIVIDSIHSDPWPLQLIIRAPLVREAGRFAVELVHTLLEREWRAMAFLTEINGKMVWSVVVNGYNGKA
jgi:hypothetical protein